LQIISNLFKGNTYDEKTYSKKDELEMREYADKLFLLSDYKRAF
jgi:hypothetical protein